jgi:NAD(P)-dependent dehydrogenase (short-subunit alcohol dehydrogenase family)
VAGVGVAATLLETSLADWDRLLGVNVTAPFLACKAVLPGMLERGHGIIVNIASVAGVVAVRDRCAYTTSKTAVVGLTRSIAADYASRGIRANAICPGTVETEWIGKILANAEDPEAARAAMAARQLDGRMGSPEEVAEGVAFLVSDGGRFMNGAAMVMDGGLSAV